MTIAQSKLLFETLHSDEPFRNRVLSASNMLECMIIIGSKGFDCSTYELRMTLDKYVKEKNPDVDSNFSLWGNIFPE